jgi:hypothetical protein
MACVALALRLELACRRDHEIERLFVGDDRRA